MKKRINYFINTYFYFNQQERKGILSLLFLLVFFQIGNFVFPKIYHKIIRSEPKPEMVEWALNDDDDGRRFEEFPSTPNHRFENKKAKININPWKGDSVYSAKKRRISYPIELNLVDSETLVSLPKIGPVLAGRIIQYRNRLRGFHSINQLMEVWGFKEDFLYDLDGKITVNSALVQAFYLNQVNFEDLKFHPYFKYTLSRALVNYRIQHGNFQAIEQIKNVKLINDSIYQVIKPYLKIN